MTGKTLQTPEGDSFDRCAKLCSEHEQCDGFIFSGRYCFLKKDSILKNSWGWKAGICPKGEFKEGVLLGFLDNG